MLLSKDRQNLLKIYSFDFLLVGMQVPGPQSLLDEHIWEYEWKRLDRHSKKAVAPILLLGYFRDILKLGNVMGDTSLRRTIEDSQVRVRKTGKRNHCIPYMCDFVTGNSEQLHKLFLDVKKLFLHPGFILQQCAYINNKTHFSKIIENPNITEEDFQYQDEATGDNPVMIAAKLRHKDLISAVLRSPKFQQSNDQGFVGELIHKSECEVG